MIRKVEIPPAPEFARCAAPRWATTVVGMSLTIELGVRMKGRSLATAQVFHSDVYEFRPHSEVVKALRLEPGGWFVLLMWEYENTSVGTLLRHPVVAYIEFATTSRAPQ